VSSRYASGQPIRLTTTVTDLTGAPVNPGALSLILRRPDGTQASFGSPANDGVGQYHQDLTAADLSQLGHYVYAWVATGTGAGVAPGPRSFDVYDPLGSVLVDLDDLKTVLGEETAEFDADLLAVLATTTALVEQITGPMLTRAVAEVVQPTCTGVIPVRQPPLVSVTSMVSIRDGSTYDTTALYVADSAAGTLRRKDGAVIWLTGPYTLTYQAGRGAAVPGPVVEAARVIAQHIWETAHSPSLRPSEVGNELAAPFLGAFAIPNRAKELLRPYADNNGFA
jgi:hypothetical protein